MSPCTLLDHANGTLDFRSVLIGSGGVESGPQFEKTARQRFKFKIRNNGRDNKTTFAILVDDLRETFEDQIVFSSFNSMNSFEL